ncbi:hypothetical protein PVL29_012001 [Vitis rotundifolia]|uniref:Uncharacterized protein n=1 Tax=Vitis rotundifolia TaxID=103349 RepID=A0AA38ZRK3_VITRO|nr:hypothetical protein PVL29_012001 [Vitis rotundifolia]
MTYSCKLVKVAVKNNPRSNSYHSLWEKSMQVAANIIKLSSFSIAKMSLGIGRTLLVTVLKFIPQNNWL